MTKQILAIFCIYFLSPIFGDVSFHYVADLEFFYQENHRILTETLKKEFGDGVTLDISSGILGVHGVKHDQVVETLEKLRKIERQQVLFEFLLFTTPEEVPQTEPQFLSLEEQKKLLESLNQKQIISRALAPSRRGIPLIWKSESQWVRHPEGKPLEGSSLSLAKFYFQGITVTLNTNAGEGPLRLCSQIELNYFDEGQEKQETFPFTGEQSETEAKIWFVPFQGKNPPLYFLISAREVPLKAFTLKKGGEPVKHNSSEEIDTKTYQIWEEEPLAIGGQLPTLPSLYQEIEVPELLPKTSGIDFFGKVLKAQFPQMEFQPVQKYMRVTGPPRLHKLLSETLELHDNYSIHQAYLTMEEFFVLPSHSSKVYEKTLPLLTKSFALEAYKDFQQDLGEEGWYAHKNFATRVCTNRNQIWRSHKRDTTFIKGIFLEQEESKVRTLSDQLSYGQGTNATTVLSANGKEYYILYDYQRNLFEQPFAEKQLDPTFSIKIQEPILYRESYQVKTFVPIGSLRSFWGLPLNLASGPRYENLTFLRLK